MTLVALLIGIAGVLMQYFIAGDNIWLIMTGVCLYSITLGMGFVSMWSMIADTVEYAEWHHGCAPKAQFTVSLISSPK
jgi:GPH family glycoside/pentoside/hexuronide:cation symporter